MLERGVPRSWRSARALARTGTVNQVMMARVMPPTTGRVMGMNISVPHTQDKRPDSINGRDACSPLGLILGIFNAGRYNALFGQCFKGGFGVCTYSA